MLCFMVVIKNLRICYKQGNEIGPTIMQHKKSSSELKRTTYLGGKHRSGSDKFVAPRRNHFITKCFWSEQIELPNKLFKLTSKVTVISTEGLIFISYFLFYREWWNESHSSAFVADDALALSKYQILPK